MNSFVKRYLLNKDNVAQSKKVAVPQYPPRRPENLPEKTEISEQLSTVLLQRLKVDKSP